MKHEDNRRTLVEWIKDFPVRSCKVVITKDGSPIGDHYHKNKTEIFYLLSGSGIVETKEMNDPSAPNISGTFNEGQSITIDPYMWHKFILAPGSILLGAATEPFDPNDEIRT